MQFVVPKNIKKTFNTVYDAVFENSCNALKLILPSDYADWYIRRVCLIPAVTLGAMVSLLAAAPLLIYNVFSGLFKSSTTEPFNKEHMRYESPLVHSKKQPSIFEPRSPVYTPRLESNRDNKDLLRLIEVADQKFEEYKKAVDRVNHYTPR